MHSTLLFVDWLVLLAFILVQAILSNANAQKEQDRKIFQIKMGRAVVPKLSGLAAWPEGEGEGMVLCEWQAHTAHSNGASHVSASHPLLAWPGS